MELIYNPEITFAKRLWKLHSPGLHHIEIENIKDLYLDKTAQKMGKFIFNLYSDIPVATKILDFPDLGNIYQLLLSHAQSVSDDVAWIVCETSNEISKCGKDSYVSENTLKKHVSPLIFNLFIVHKYGIYYSCC